MNTAELLSQGLKHQQAGRLKEASNCYQSVLESSPDNADALSLLGRIAMERRQFPSACELLHKALRVRPEDPAVQATYAQCLFLNGDKESAVQGFEKAVQLDPQQPAILYGAAVCCINTQYYAQAETYLDRFLSIDPRHTQAHHQLGLLFQQQEKWPEAIASFTRFLELSESPVPGLLMRAECHHAAGAKDKAITDYRRVLELHPEHDVALTNLGIYHLVALEPDEAIPLFRRALHSNTENNSARQNLSSALRLQGAHAEATELLKTVIQQHPEDAAAHYLLGATQFESGALEDAFTSLSHASKLNPYDRRTMATLSVLLPELGRYDEAAGLIDYEHLLSIESVETPAGYEHLGAFNKDLYKHIEAHPTLDYERSGNTTRHGWHTGNLLDQDPGPAGLFADLVNLHVRQYLKRLKNSGESVYRAWQPEDWHLSVWGVILESSGYQDPHIHTDGWLSGVYYIQIPSVIRQTDSNAGYIEFGRGKSSFGCKDSAMIKLIQPEEGKMVLFPSFYYHRTIPFESNEKRACLAFDVRPSIRSDRKR